MIEQILWIVSWFLISEVLFILFRVYMSNGDMSWIWQKTFAFVIGAVFMGMQLVIVFGGSHTEIPLFVEQVQGNYFNLVWEALIILGISIFFGVNYLVKELINKKMGIE